VITSTFLHNARRRLAEFLTVFLGVALAFVAENWREDLADRRDERVAIAGLLADFSANEDRLDRLLEIQVRLLTGSQRLLDVLSAAQDGALVSVPDTLLLAFVGWGGGYRPDRGTLDGLVNSGQLELISDNELRQAIATWPSEVADEAMTSTAEGDLLGQIVAYGLTSDLPIDQLTADWFPWIRSSGAAGESVGHSVSIRNSKELRFLTFSRVNLGNLESASLVELAEVEDNILHLLAQVH
jgi:hypothetical protein